MREQDLSSSRLDKIYIQLWPRPSMTQYAPIKPWQARRGALSRALAMVLRGYGVSWADEDMQSVPSQLECQGRSTARHGLLEGFEPVYTSRHASVRRVWVSVGAWERQAQRLGSVQLPRLRALGGCGGIRSLVCPRSHAPTIHAYICTHG